MQKNTEILSVREMQRIQRGVQQMQVKNYSIFMGDDTIQNRHTGKKDAKQKSSGKSIDGRGIAAASDPIAAKRAQAQKKAMKIFGDAFAGESKIDDDMSERRERVKSLQQEIAEKKQSIKELEDTRDSLLEQGFDENSEEVRKLTEGIKEYNKQAMEAENERMAENAVIRETKLERLKSNPMGEAKEQADAVMEAANDEILGMLVAEGREQIDKKQAEEKQKAEAAAEKKQEQEEKLEARKEDKKEQEKLMENIVEASQKLDGGGTDSVAQAQQEIRDMLNRMKLVAEDVKGSTVDQGV